MTERSQFHVKRGGQLRSNRGNFNSQWEEAAAKIVPSHRDTFLGTGNTVAGNEGQKKTEQQFDSTAALACQRYSSVMESICTPQGALWGRLQPVDKMLKRNRQVRIFFDDLSDLLNNYRYRPIGNFVGNMQQVYFGQGAYGNGSLFVDQPDRDVGIRYRNIHLGEIYFAENHSGTIDTFYRFFSLTATQMVSQFGADKVPDQVREAAKNPGQSENKFEVLHCVYPRDDADPTRADYKGMPYVSLHIAMVDQSELREGGYRSFPLPVTRYMQAPGEVYGRGPGQIVLASIKLLNQQKKDFTEQSHRALRPAFLTHDDGVLGTLNLKAGATNPGGVSKEGRALVHAMPVGDISVGQENMDMERDLINSAFLIDLFQVLVDNPQMTATEVLERAREKGMLLSPTAGRFQAEFLGPLIGRELSLLASQGIWPPNMPSILKADGIEFKIEYDSPISRMARAEKATGWNRTLLRTTEYVKLTGDPEPLDWLDHDAAAPELADIDGVPAEWIRSPDAVAARRASRAEQAQTQQMVEAAPAVAGLMKATQ